MALVSFWLLSSTPPKAGVQLRDFYLIAVSARTRPVTPRHRELCVRVRGVTGTIRFEPQENVVSMAPSDNGFLLLDAGLNLIAANDPALQVLCFPSTADRIKQPTVFVADRIRATLVDHRHPDGPAFVKEFQSGKRRYICKSFQVDCNGYYSVQPAFVVLLERGTAASTGLTEISEQFDLTQRESETVEFLLQGFASKEIATRMKISPNTVKAFLRLVMVKMKVSTRSGIAGRIAGARPNS